MDSDSTGVSAGKGAFGWTGDRPPAQLPLSQHSFVLLSALTATGALAHATKRYLTDTRDTLAVCVCHKSNYK